MPIKKGKLINPNKYLVTAEQNQTHYKQNKSSGQMTGRTVSNNGDNTRNIRAKGDIEVDGKPGIGKNDFHGGQILGRLKRGETKPSQIEVTSYYDKEGGFTKHHIRKIHKK